MENFGYDTFRNARRSVSQINKMMMMMLLMSETVLVRAVIYKNKTVAKSVLFTKVWEKRAENFTHSKLLYSTLLRRSSLDVVNFHSTHFL